MSVSIGWKKKNPQDLEYIDSTSKLHSILEEKFGDFPIELDRTNINFLEGLNACGHSGAYELIQAIYRNEEIIVEASW